MSWRNVFDLGECEVHAATQSGQLIPPSEWGDYGIDSVEVVDGEVIVTGYAAQGVSFTVLTAFQISPTSVRISGMSMEDDSGNQPLHIISAHYGSSSSQASDKIEVQPVGAGPVYSYEPDPASFSGLEGNQLAGINVMEGS